MKSGNFTGWRSVFAFTFAQDTKGRYKKTTIGVGLAFLIVGAVISIIMALVQKSDGETVSPINTVYVINNSDIKDLSFDSLTDQNKDKYPSISFENTDKDEMAVANSINEDNNLILKIENKDEGFNVSAIIPNNSSLSKGDVNDLLDDLSNSIEESKLISSGISPQMLAIAMSHVSVNKINASDKQQSVGEEIVNQLLPMIISMLMYFIILIYGMAMGNSVSVEKTSKLMEMVLTMTKPAALVFGKVFALTTAAIIQVLVWIGLFTGGFILGDYVAKTMIYPEYENVILEVLNLLKGQTNGVAFSAGAFVLMGVTIIVGILFYFLLAALVGSFAQKTEEVQSYMGVFTILSVAGFMAVIYLPMSDGNKWDTLLRVVPFTSAYILPADILLGKVTLVSGFVYMLILFAFALVAVFLAGKIYMNQLFHRGESLLSILKRKSK